MSEIIYLGDYDNTIDIRLDSDGIAIVTTSITQIDANIGGVDVSSTNQPEDLIRWSLPGYETGEVRCKLGSLGLMVGTADCYLIVYDPTNPNGVVFGPIGVEIHDLP